jgi:hypothetical protein
VILGFIHGISTMPQRDRFYPRARNDKMPKLLAGGTTYDIERRERQRVYTGVWREIEQEEATPRLPPSAEAPKPRAH